MRKTWEILNKIEELKSTNNEDIMVQKRLLEFVLNWKAPVNDLIKNLTYMYDITTDKQEIKNTINDLPFDLAEVLSASDILAWILEIPKKTHKKNIKNMQKLDDKNYGAENFLGTL